MRVITLESRVSLRDDLLTLDVDDATVIANEGGGDSYGVEQAARRIWQLLKHPSTVAELCEVLASEYDVDRKTCQVDVLEFLNDSAREGFIQIGD